MDRRSTKDSSRLLVWLLITAALAIVSVYVRVVVLAIPLALTYMIVCFDTMGGVLGVAAMGIAAVFSPPAAAAFIAGSVPVSVTAAIAIRRRWRFRDAVISASIAALAGVALCIALLWLFRGLSLTEYVVERVGGMFSLLGDSEINLLYQALRGPDILLGAITQQAVLAAPRAEAIDVMLSALRELVNYDSAVLMLNYALLWGLLCSMVPRRFAARRGMPVKAVPVFSDYALPKNFWIAFVVSYLAAIVLDSLRLSPFGMLEPAISSVYAFVLTVQALSFADYYYKAQGLRTGTRVLLHVAAVLVFGTYLMWVGLFENIVQFRSRNQEKGGAEL